MGNSIGFLGAVCQPTDVPGIITWDLNATDHFAPPSHPTRLLHNPHATAQTATVDVGAAPRDIYDAVSGRFVRHGVAGPQAFALAPDQAAVLVLVPAGATPRREGTRLIAGGAVIDNRAQPADVADVGANHAGSEGDG